MPQSDPILSPSGSTKRRIRRILGLVALLSISVAAIALALVAHGDPTPFRHFNMLIATALGVGLTVLAGTDDRRLHQQFERSRGGSRPPHVQGE